MQASDLPIKFAIPFASSAGTGFVRQVPETTTTPGAASDTAGFPPPTFLDEGAGGIPMDGEDLNGILLQITQWSRWQAAGGPIAYDSVFQSKIGGYPRGAIVASATASFGLFWQCLVDNNTTNPDTGGAGWTPYTPLVPAYLNGLTINTTLGNALFGVAAGIAADGTNVAMMTLSSAYTKTTGTWAVGSGNGALDTGTIAVNSSYGVFEMQRLDTGVVDIIIAKGTAGVPPNPVLPSGYTLTRRIGYIMTDGSANIIPVIQHGDRFQYFTTPSVLDFNGTPSTGSRTLENLSVPLGTVVEALFNIEIPGITGIDDQYVWLSDPATADIAPHNGSTPLASYGLGVSQTGAQVSTSILQSCYTNTSGQIGMRGKTTNPVQLQPIGWVDRRGKGN